MHDELFKTKGPSFSQKTHKIEISRFRNQYYYILIRLETWNL